MIAPARCARYANTVYVLRVACGFHRTPGIVQPHPTIAGWSFPPRNEDAWHSEPMRYALMAALMCPMTTMGHPHFCFHPMPNWLRIHATNFDLGKYMNNAPLQRWNSAFPQAGMQRMHGLGCPLIPHHRHDMHLSTALSPRSTLPPSIASPDHVPSFPCHTHRAVR